MLELAKNIKIVILTVFHIFKKLGGKWNLLNRNRKNIQKIQIQFLEMQTILSAMVNSKLDTLEEKISEFEAIAVETIKVKHRENEESKRIERASVSYQ